MNTKKNKDEIRAKKYLQTLKFTQIEYEPLGNVTPDFLLDRNIAVEVRRLNRNFINTKNLLNVENLEILLVKNINKIINTYLHKAHKNSAYISLTFLKPLTMQSKKNIIKKVKKILKKHVDYMTEEKKYTVSKSLEIKFTPTTKKSNTYVLATCNGDYLWLVHELHKSIQSVIDEKNEKIDKNFKLYKEWWLVLVDSIIDGLSDEDFEELKKIKPKKRRFTKVIILSPKGDFKTFEF